MLQTSGNKKRMPQQFGIHSTTKHKPLTHPTQESEMKEITIHQQKETENSTGKTGLHNRAWSLTILVHIWNLGLI
jgi:hypothetical protein